MYTDCPACHRQFRVRASHLGAAAGLVQCGFCGQRYNALERLHDEPLTQPAAGSPPQDEVLPGAGQAGGFDDDGFDIPADIPAPAPRDETEEPAPKGARARPGTPAGDPAAVTTGGVTASQRDKSPAEQAWSVPAELLQQEDGGVARKPRRLLWSLALLLVLLAGALQAAWFHRDRLLSEYPDLMPWALQVCDYFQCEVIRHRDLDAIQVINRDVRDHPRYAGALLVNATIVNNSSEVQPFPVVRLSLFDTAGKLIAYRRFQPGEYLDTSVNQETGMPPGNPVHIVLEVVGPTRGAVSFEFDFLPVS